MRSVIDAALLPGIGFALAGITFAAVTAFLTLMFALNRWPHGALAFTALIAARVVVGHLSDRYGGARVALACLAVQAIGPAMIGSAGAPAAAILGAIVCGGGFSLVSPSLGLEAVRRAPPGKPAGPRWASTMSCST